MPAYTASTLKVRPKGRYYSSYLMSRSPSIDKHIFVMAPNHNILLETGTNELELIEFALRFKDELGDIQEQPMGINVIKVREIIRMPEITRLPDLADGVIGILNLRGQIIPAFDLGALLYEEDAIDEGNRMIVAEFNGIRIGLIVYSVNRIHRISWSMVKPPESIQSINDGDSTVVGVVHEKDKSILMIDVEKIVADVNTELALSAKDIVESTYGVNYTVLTAEDSSVIRAMIVRELSKVGFNIISTFDGLSAWNKLQEYRDKKQQDPSVEDRIDMVITDIEMPQMDGYTLVKNIKQDDFLKNIPTMIFSSMITEDNRHKGESVGVNAQLTKPEIGKLLDTARGLLHIESPKEA